MTSGRLVFGQRVRKTYAILKTIYTLFTFLIHLKLIMLVQILLMTYFISIKLIFLGHIDLFLL